MAIFLSGDLLYHSGFKVPEIHIIFDNPGRLGETPKYFERYRRDCTAQVMTGHLCDEVNGNTIIPKPWRANFINCRNCKRSLVIFITKHLLKFASQFMHDGQMLVLAGGFDGDIEDTAWTITKVKSTSSSDSSSEVLVEPNPNLRCVAEETDTRLWLHVKKPNCSNILIMSTDTDIYNIGLPLLSVCDKNIMVQLNPYYSKELKYLHFTAFLQVLQNDPDLSSIPAEKIPQIFQSLFVSTGCDYISFFSEMGKASMYRTFYQDAEFISSGNFPFLGTLADTEIISDQFEIGFLAFLRLIGAAYFKKHKNGFEHTKPRSHYCTFNKPGLSPLECHTQWLQDVRIKVSERSQFENQMVPNIDALIQTLEKKLLGDGHVAAS